MVIFYKKWKKYNEIQLTKSKMDLNIRKMTNHPPSSGNKWHQQELWYIIGEKYIQTMININIDQSNDIENNYNLAGLVM